jgi:hypothetical protein
MEDELHFIMGYHIRQNHTGKEKFEKSKRIKNFLSGKIEDFITVFYMREYFQRGRRHYDFQTVLLEKY